MFTFTSFVLASSLFLVVLSNKITDRLFDAPQQIHIASATRSSFRISWKTKNITASVCSYGLEEHLLNSKAVGEDGKQYLEGHGFHHHVLLSDLPLNKQYFYQCGDGESKVNMSPVIGFNTAPTPTQTVNMAFLGDWGYLDSVARPMDIGLGGLALNWTATLTRELLETLKDQKAIDLVFITGDVGYADDSFGHKRENLRMGYEPCYDGFMSWHQNVSSIMPLMVAPGNHESECHDPYCLMHLQETGLPLSNFSAYNTRFAMPSTESGGVLNMWYSFDWGPVHVTSINTETDFPGAGEEKTGDGHFPFLPAGGFGAYDGAYMDWVGKDLAAASANREVSWIVATGHRPFEDLPTDNQQQLAALFKKYGVAMYFAGHGHTYIRYDQNAWGDNTVHIMPGASGNDETPYPVDQLDPIPESLSAAESCQAWCSSASVMEANKKMPDPCGHCINKNGVSPVFQTDKMSLGVLTASTTSLEWKLYRAPDGALLDTISLTK